MAAIPADTETSVAGLRLMGGASRVEERPELEGMLEKFRTLTASGLERPIVDVGGGEDGVFTARRLQLALA